MYEDSKSKISQLEKVLDAREDLVTGKVKRHELHLKDFDVKSNWEEGEARVGEEILASVPPKKTASFSTKFLIGSIIFFVIAMVVVAVKFLFGGNVVSGDNIAVTVKVPSSVASGEVLSMEIAIKNNNNIALSGVDMNITFPAGTKQVKNTSEPVVRLQEFLGDISPGQTIKKNISVILFGQANERKDMNISLEYKVAGSNSLFNKNKAVSVLVNSSPVSLTVTGPKEINTNQNVDYSLEITSNSPTVIKNLLLKVDYPFGFIFSSANPKTFSKNNLWLVGDLEPGAKRVIKFSGALNGQEGEERGFNFSLGSQSKTDALAFDAVYASSFSSTVIRRPFVSADIYFNGLETNEFIVGAGAKVETVIKWQNNLPYEVSDVSIAVKLTGNSLDKSSVDVSGGLYRSAENLIVFNKITNPDLAVLEPGKKGESKFSFGSFGVGSVTGASLSNPVISLEIAVKGKRTDYSVGQEDIFFSDSRKVKITSDPQLFAKALYFIGPFKNTGPIPPQAEKETTYTITWLVTNPLNNLANTRVFATLPPDVKWVGKISPDREKVDYNPENNSIVWSVGNVSAGAGILSPAREVSFQVSILPSVIQIGETPILIGQSTLTAKDNFTLTAVSDAASELDARLINDPYFRSDMEVVIQ